MGVHARDAKITAAYLYGESVPELADRFGLSKERIYQIIHQTCRYWNARTYHDIFYHRESYGALAPYLRRHRHRFCSRGQTG